MEMTGKESSKLEDKSIATKIQASEKIYFFKKICTLGTSQDNNKALISMLLQFYKKEKDAGGLFEEAMVENFPIWWKTEDVNLQVQEA